jgi:hypothetical protein
LIALSTAPLSAAVTIFRRTSNCEIASKIRSWPLEELSRRASSSSVTAPDVAGVISVEENDGNRARGATSRLDERLSGVSGRTGRFTVALASFSSLATLDSCPSIYSFIYGKKKQSILAYEPSQIFRVICDDSP